METENKQPNGGRIVYTIIAIIGAIYGAYVLITI